MRAPPQQQSRRRGHGAHEPRVTPAPAAETQAKAFDRHPNLVRAMATSRAGNLVRSVRRPRRLEAQNRALREITGNLPAAEQRQAEAVFGYLSNMLAWLTMRDENGFSGEQSGRAISWAMRELIDDLRRRNEAAGAQQARPASRRHTDE
jgi:hypothetical protein